MANIAKIGGHMWVGVFTLIFLCFAVSSKAQGITREDTKGGLPLVVENVLARQGLTLLDFTISYANQEREQVAIGEPILVQIGPTAFVEVPSSINVSERNGDSVIATLALRRGIAQRTELYARTSALHNEVRGSSTAGPIRSSRTGFADAWFGMSYQFREDGTGPAMLGFAEVAVAEKLRVDTRALKSAVVGLTAYKALDPVVLSGSVAYRLNGSRLDGIIRSNPGNVILVAPSIGFAANERVSLTGGFQWRRTGAGRSYLSSTAFSRTQTDLTLGAAYGFERAGTLNLTIVANASGRSGADLRLNWLHPF